MEELYGKDTDADLIAASQQFDIATDSVPHSAAVTMSKTDASERPFASAMPQAELDELNRSRFAKKTVDKSIWAVTVFGEWRAHRNGAAWKSLTWNGLIKQVRFLTLFPITHFMTVFVYVKSFGSYLQFIYLS